MLATDRIRRADPGILPETPVVVVSRSGSKRTVATIDAAALKAGARIGMPAAKPQAMISGLHLVDADRQSDALAIERPFSETRLKPFWHRLIGEHG